MEERTAYQDWHTRRAAEAIIHKLPRESLSPADMSTAIAAFRYYADAGKIERQEAENLVNRFRYEIGVSRDMMLYPCFLEKRIAGRNSEIEEIDNFLRENPSIDVEIKQELRVKKERLLEENARESGTETTTGKDSVSE